MDAAPRSFGGKAMSNKEPEVVALTTPDVLRLLHEETAPGLVTTTLTRHKEDPIRGEQVALITLQSHREAIAKKDATLKASVEAIEILWDLLDDIAKSDHATYRKMVESIQARRFEKTGISTDGYFLQGGAAAQAKEALG